MIVHVLFQALADVKSLFCPRASRLALNLYLLYHKKSLQLTEFKHAIQAVSLVIQIKYNVNF